MADRGAVDPRDLDPEALRELLPVGPKQIPVWFGCAWIGAVMGAVYNIGFAWSLHSSTYGFGPAIVRWIGRSMHWKTDGFADFFGSTTFVVVLNVLALLSLRRHLGALGFVRGVEKRPLVAKLLRHDVRQLVWTIVVLSIVGYIFYRLGLFRTRGRGGFDPLEWIADIYRFYWGFTQERHPHFSFGPAGSRVPLIVRAGAIAVFVSLVTLALRLLASTFYLLFTRAGPPDAWSATTDLPPS